MDRADTQKKTLLGAISTINERQIRHTRENRIVLKPPIRSSKRPMKAAPMPAVRLMAIANPITSSCVKPNTLVAYIPPKA